MDSNGWPQSTAATSSRSTRWRRPVPPRKPNLLPKPARADVIATAIAMSEGRVHGHADTRPSSTRTPGPCAPVAKVDADFVALAADDVGRTVLTLRGS